MRFAFTPIAFAVAMLIAAPLHAQHQVEAPPDQPTLVQPADPAVGDLDPLSHSLRRIEPGNAQFNPHTPMHRVQPGAPNLWQQLGRPSNQFLDQRAHRYRYEAPGVSAWVRRPEYITRDREGFGPALNHTPRRDGQHRALIPPDTIFDLTPPTPAPNATADDHWVDRRLNTRLDTRLDGRADDSVPQAQSPRRATMPEHVRRILRAGEQRRVPTPSPSDNR
ncbi:MAG: hypothetical protein ACODAQ_04250 [Phycisphaeraceae bacterium]